MAEIDQEYYLQLHKDKLINSVKSTELLFNSLGMQEFSRVIHICHYVLETQHLSGDIVEFGCHKGDTSKLISFISNKSLYVFDSFEGLPESIEQIPAGEMKVSIDELYNNFARDGIRTPYVKKAWFSDLKPEDIPEKISFAHLDGDLYQSTLDSLKLIYDRLVPGAVVLIDDYGHDMYWPGVKIAALDFFKDKPEEVVELKGMRETLAYKALIKKL
jgi:O-methyltransferase